MDLFLRKSIRKKDIQSLKDGKDEETNGIFYVTRFYRNQDTMHEFIDDTPVDR